MVSDRATLKEARRALEIALNALQDELARPPVELSRPTVTGQIRQVLAAASRPIPGEAVARAVLTIRCEEGDERRRQSVIKLLSRLSRDPGTGVQKVERGVYAWTGQEAVLH